jgi:hypothetical protein
MHNFPNITVPFSDLSVKWISAAGDKNLKSSAKINKRGGKIRETKIDISAE